MEYYVEIKENALIFLKKLDYGLREQVEKTIRSLRVDPIRKGVYLGSFRSGIVFYEKRIFSGPGMRIYYSVLPGRIVVQDIEYIGIVPVHRVGNKKTRKKDIAELKRL